MEDRSGAIWCGTFSGLFRLMKGGSTFEPVDIGMPLARGGDDAIVSALLEDRQGILWVGVRLPPRLRQTVKTQFAVR